MNKIYRAWKAIRRHFICKHRACPPIEDPLQHLPPHIRADLPPWHEPAPDRTDCNKGRPSPGISLRIPMQ